MGFKLGTVAKNSLAVFVTKIVELLSGIFVIMLLTRYLGKEDFGEYSFITGFILLRFIIDFGIDPIFFREISKDRGAVKRLLGAIFIAKGGLSILTLLIGLLIVAFLDISAISRVSIMIVLLSQVPVSFSFSFFSIFRGYEKMEYETLITFLYRSIFIGLTAIFVLLKLDFIFIFIFLLLSEGVRFLLSLVVIVARFTRLELGLDWKWVPFILKEGLPLAITAFFSTGTMKLGIFLIKFLRDSEFANREIALFQVPNVVVWQINFLPVAISTALFPVFSRLYQESLSEVKGVFENGFRLYSILSWWFVTIILFFSEEAILILSGSEFSEGAINLRILVFSLPFLFFEQLGSMLLIAANRQRFVLYTTISCFATYLFSGIILTYHRGDTGCALSALLAFIVQFGFSFYFASKLLEGISLLRPFLLPLSSSLLLILLYTIFDIESLLVRLIIALFLYPGLNMVMGSAGIKDIRFFKDAMKRRN